jgi:hypothetical protein
VAGGGVTLPEPLQWVIGTLTVWHYAILAVFMAINAWPWPKVEGTLPLPVRLWASIVIPTVLYTMASLVVGQIVGDRYTWSMLWPAGLGLGAVFATIVLSVLLDGVWSTQGRQTRPALMLVIAIPLTTAFFGLFFTCVWWLFPRIIGFGLIDFPKLSWGVQL